MIPIKIAQLHYHVKQSGVKTVMINTLNALDRYGNFKGFYLITSKGEKLIKNLKIIDVKDLAYSDKLYKSKKDFLKAAERLKNKLVVRIDKVRGNDFFIVHSHNVTIGKNSVLIAALKLLAEHYLDDKVFFINQIHDFAEDNRPDRIYVLYHCTGKKDIKFAKSFMYPEFKNMVYCVINSKDIGNLMKFGRVKRKKIFLLPNCVDINFFTAKPKTKGLKEKIKEFALKNNFLFDDNKKILLMPMKVFSRKNIAEALLLLKFFDNYQLLITRGAESKNIGYENKLKRFIRKNKLNVVIGFGDYVTSKGNTIVDVFGLASAILTTSMNEGFGFAFLEGWLAKKIVIGRDLPAITKDFKKNGISFRHMYDKLNVRVKNRLVDFGKLDVDKQLKIIKKIKKEEFFKYNPKAKKMFEMLGKDNKKLIQKNKKAIMRNYSLKAKAGNVKRIVKKLLD